MRHPRDVPLCPSAQVSVPLVHPIPQSPRDIWDIKGCPMVSLSTILCPTCPSHPSVPKRHMGHQGMSYGAPQHSSLSTCPSHPSVPKRHMGHQGICPMVSLSTVLCPTCPSHPSVPKRHMGHQGMSYGVPQHNSLSHLSIPSLSPQGTYGTSREVPWCPSTQYCIPYVHPSTSSQRDVQNIMGCPMESPTQLPVPPAHPLSPLHTTVFH